MLVPNSAFEIPVVVMLRGYPGSGKSTLAKQIIQEHPNEQFIEINRDDLRKEQPGWVRNKFNKAIEAEVKRLRDSIAELNLKKGISVISSDTNLAPSNETHWKQLAQKWNAEFMCIDLTDPNSKHYVSIETCIKRDLQRDYSVGKDVILKMWYQFGKFETQPFIPDNPSCIICDLDGTLAHTDGKRGPFEENYTIDSYDPAVAMIVGYCYSDMDVILVSGRKGTAVGRAQTEEWLNTHHIPYTTLIMRAEDDDRDDAQVKRDIFDAHIRGKYNVKFVLDDRKRVCRMWEQLGLKVLRVGPEYDFDIAR